MSLSRLDFNAIKGRARFERVLEHYGLKFPGSGVQRFILCPFHRESTPSCSIHLTRRIFHCFGCGAKGTVIDFVAMIERIDLRAAAIKVSEICKSELGELDHEAALPAEFRETADECHDSYRRGTIPPLPTALVLDPRHPYLTGRGLTPEIIDAFGLGYCDRGPMRGRICIPIHDTSGNLIAYAGRWASDTIPKGVSRYKLPPAFEKRRVLFNLHRVPAGNHIVLVEGYWSVFRLHAFGVPAVSLMGSSLSPDQIALLRCRNTRFVTVLMDGDEAGRAARERMLPEIANKFFVRAPLLRNGQKPDTFAAQQLLEMSVP